MDWLGEELCLSGPVTPGVVHGVVVWIEDGGRELDPTEALVGVLTLRAAEEVGACHVRVTLAGSSPADLTCSCAFHRS